MVWCVPWMDLQHSQKREARRERDDRPDEAIINIRCMHRQPGQDSGSLWP